MQEIIQNSPDLKKLWNEGYEIEVENAHLIIRNVPYLTSTQNIKRGTLVSTLNLAGDRTIKPETHVAYFAGEMPCTTDGSKISQIIESGHTVLSNKITVNHTFSSKPKPSGEYSDYYEKIKTYDAIISSQAKSVDSSVTSCTFQVREFTESESVFRYHDTNSSRAKIHPISTKLQNQNIAIIGMGGTGSYLLDFISKTCVSGIHIFDGDFYGQHNAFRAPGATEVETLRKRPLKVNHFAEVYSRLHRGVQPHPYYLKSEQLDELAKMDFVFLCLDNGKIKKDIIDFLADRKKPFIDAGIGVLNIDQKLLGQVRTTFSSPAKCDHISNRINYVNVGENEYVSNIQIAELNALNAALAVIKWKKYYGVYHDSDQEHNSTFVITNGKVINEDCIS